MFLLHGVANVYFKHFKSNVYANRHVHIIPIFIFFSYVYSKNAGKDYLQDTVIPIGIKSLNSVYL